MIRFKIVAAGLIITALASLSAAGNKPLKPPLIPPPVLPPPVQPKENPDPRMAQFLVCAKACDDCARICRLCEGHATKLLAQGRKEHLETARTCADCAAICSAGSNVAAHHGPLSDLICSACADACKRCGDLCQKFAADPIMKQCADECRRCEKACREMVKNIVKPADDPKPEK